MATTSPLLDIQQRATELCAAGQLMEAAQLLSTAIALDPKPVLWNDWGAVQFCLGQIEDAEEGFRRALALDSANFETWANLGALLATSGRKTEAIPCLQQALGTKDHPYRKTLEGLLANCLEAARPDAPSFELTHFLPSTEAPAVAAAPSLAPPATLPASVSYEDWFESVFKKRVPAPGARVAVSWPEDTSYGKKAHTALIYVECEYVSELLQEIQTKNIPGAIGEFGIFEGWWINHLWQATERLGLHRRIYGFDSFEGLSEPHPQFDSTFWKRGQYACGYERVRNNVRAGERPRIKLVPGFFEKSLHSAEAQVAKQFCYARIDCDIYQPALDCLRYLGPRLADGAILIFDDWPHHRGEGEQLAFEQWLPEVPHLEFEFLFYGTIGHFYTRVHHRK